MYEYNEHKLQLLMENIYVHTELIHLSLNIKFYKASRRNGNGYSIDMLNSDTSNSDHFNVYKLYTWNVSHFL